MRHKILGPKKRIMIACDHARYVMQWDTRVGGGPLKPSQDTAESQDSHLLPLDETTTNPFSKYYNDPEIQIKWSDGTWYNADIVSHDETTVTIDWTDFGADDPQQIELTSPDVKGVRRIVKETIKSIEAIDNVDEYTDEKHGLTYILQQEYDNGDSEPSPGWKETDFSKESLEHFMRMQYEYWNAFALHENWAKESGKLEHVDKNGALFVVNNSSFEAAGNSEMACIEYIDSLHTTNHLVSNGPDFDALKTDQKFRTARQSLSCKAFVSQGYACNCCKDNETMARNLSSEQFKMFHASIKRGKWPGGTFNYELDHVIPTAWGGSSDSENLQVLCNRCHIAKSAIERMFNAQVARALKRKFDANYTSKGPDAHLHFHPTIRPDVYLTLWNLNKKLWHLVCPIKRYPVNVINAKMERMKVQIQVEWTNPHITVGGVPFTWKPSWFDLVEKLTSSRHVRNLFRYNTVVRNRFSNNTLTPFINLSLRQKVENIEALPEVALVDIPTTIVAPVALTTKNFKLLIREFVEDIAKKAIRTYVKDEAVHNFISHIEEDTQLPESRKR